jgi:hypothetical protein
MFFFLNQFVEIFGRVSDHSNAEELEAMFRSVLPKMKELNNDLGKFT